MQKLKSGLKYDIRMEINKKWGFYDKTVAECHLNNYGKIFIDEYGCPIDNEYDLMEIEEKERGILK